jgi:hypothetical protein
MDQTLHDVPESRGIRATPPAAPRIPPREEPPAFLFGVPGKKAAGALRMLAPPPAATLGWLSARRLPVVASPGSGLASLPIEGILATLASITNFSQ